MNVNGSSRRDGAAARFELLDVAPAAALADLVERDRVQGVHGLGRAARDRPSGRVDHDDRAQVAAACSRIAAIFASCSVSSQTIAQASESEITHRHSSGELVW